MVKWVIKCNGGLTFESSEFKRDLAEPDVVLEYAHFEGALD